VHFLSAACTCGLEGRVKYAGNIEHVILYVVLHICLSILDYKIYVFHVSELMFRGKLFMMLSVLHFEISIGDDKVRTSVHQSLMCNDILLNLLRYFLMVLNARI